MSRRYLNNEDLEQLPSTEKVIDAGTLTATTDDFNPTGFDSADIVMVDIDLNNREITGMLAPPIGVNRVIAISNKSTSGLDIRFKHNNPGSSANNRYLLRDDNQKSIKPNETGIFWYDHTVSKWKPFNRIG